MDYEEHTEAHALSHGAEVMSNSLGTDNSTNILFASNLDGAFYSKILVFIIIAIYALASFARWLGREKANE